MARLEWQEFERIAGEFFAKEFGTRLLPHWPVRLKNGRTHKFDFSSDDESLLIQCKSLTWTESGNYPNGKADVAHRAIRMLHESQASRKLIAFDDHLNHKGQSFLEVFVRRNKDSLSGIKVWRHYNQEFGLYFGSVDTAGSLDADFLDLATTMLVDQCSRAHAEIRFSFHEIAQRLATDTERVRRLATVIEARLKDQGIRVERIRDSFRLPLAT